VISRRNLLRQFAVAPALFYRRGLFAQQLVETPALTLGPYYPDRLPLDQDNDLLLINDSITPAVGSIFWVSGRVLDSSGQPVRGAVVEIWQADTNGAYIHSASPIANRDRNFQGYGKFETASDGRYLFRTVYPGIYPGRTRHIHYQIKVPGRGQLVTQLHFAGEPLNATDGILNGVRDAAQRASIIRPVEAVEGSAIGERQTSFDIVMSLTAEEPPSGSLPVISSRSGVVNAAGFQPGSAPGTWLSIHGFRLSPTTRVWTTADFVDGKLPVSLDGVSVTINGKNAFVYYISPTQINVLAPAETLTGTAEVIVRNPEGASAPTPVTLYPALPAFFRLAAGYVMATTAEGAYLGPPNLVEGMTTRPARPAETITLWGTGFGPTVPEVRPGEIVTSGAPLLHPVTIRIGAVAAVVTYAGLTGAGLNQFNLIVPDLPDGDYPVVAEILGMRTGSAARIRIQR
jgi:protocatechuate 3,4-dioxygenase beta subunit